MATLRELKTRIGSVSSSEKITGAMKMISSAKVHKNEQALRRLLPYKNQIKSIMANLLAANSGEYHSPLIESREVSTVGLVVYGTDDGLCGAYNLNIFKGLVVEVNALRERYGKNVEIVLMPVGNKMLKACRHLEGEGIAIKTHDGVDSKMEGDTVNEFTHQLRNDFLSGAYDLVKVVYMSFKSMSRQVLTVDQLFPVSPEGFSGDIAGPRQDKMYIFEPDANTIFQTVLPMFVLSTMQEVTIENRASEQAARVMAMQAANDNARKLLDELRLQYNKLRQQSITTELLDILGGQIGRE